MEQTYREQKPIRNRLWLARKRAGYLQKWVAPLLGQRSLSVISEYEKGRKLPSLRTALKLEILYGTPLSQLYSSLYGELSQEVENAKHDHPSVRKRDAEMSQACDLNRQGHESMLSLTKGDDPRSLTSYATNHEVTHTRNRP